MSETKLDAGRKAKTKRGHCEQAVERVDHTMSADQLTTLGNEIESAVLNRVVQWHAEHRTFEFGHRTVVLR